jgi:agmatine/peptidylarginine deiminase
MEEEIKSLRTKEGKAYNLVSLPLPDAIYNNNERLPATYANFLIINGAVLCPTYNQSAKDRTAMECLQSIFPDREIIGIDSRVLIHQHGSLHCCTMQYPS